MSQAVSVSGSMREGPWRILARLAAGRGTVAVHEAGGLLAELAEARRLLAGSRLPGWRIVSAAGTVERVVLHPDGVVLDETEEMGDPALGLHPKLGLCLVSGYGSDSPGWTGVSGVDLADGRWVLRGGGGVRELDSGEAEAFLRAGIVPPVTAAPAPAGELWAAVLDRASAAAEAALRDGSPLDVLTGPHP